MCDDGWRPIESAPKDGTGILAYQNGNMRVCCWTLSGWAFYQKKPGHPVVTMIKPTHWMPLPATPAGASAPAPQERSEWLARHVDQGHGIKKREHYDECSCGATFWRQAAAPASAPPETRYEFYQRLRQTPQFAQAEMEASAPRLYASEVKRDPEKAIRRIEKLRELLAWFTLRYQLEHEKPASAPPEGIAADDLRWLAVAKERDKHELLVTFSHNKLQSIIDAVEALSSQLASLSALSARWRETSRALTGSSYSESAHQLAECADDLDALIVAAAKAHG